MTMPREMWDERYSSDEFAFGIEPNDFLREHIDALPAGPVLCIGDGEGRNGVFVASVGHIVTSVDLSPVGLAKAAGLASSRGVELRTVAADLVDFVETPAAGEAWSGVVSIFCHLPSAVRSRVYPPLIDALAPGGVFIIESYTPEQIALGTGGPRDPDLLLTAAQLRDELAGLTFEHLVELTRPVIEGRFHTGTAAVVQAIARKPLPGREV